MGVVSSCESYVCAYVQISISIALCNFEQDGLDTVRFTTPHDSSPPSRKACHMGVAPSRELYFVHFYKFLFLLPFVTLDRMVWTLLDSPHLMAAVHPVERRVLWAWFRHVSRMFVHKFKFLFLLLFVTLNRMVWTLLDSPHLMTAVHPVERRVIWAWLHHVSCILRTSTNFYFYCPS